MSLAKQHSILFELASPHNLTEMRPVRNGEGIGNMRNLKEKQSFGHHVKELWDEWEIQCLILVSFFLQENLTTFSKEDNDLWKRHLLNLVIQVVVAGYVISTSSWTDRRLQAAVVLMFLCGCLRYTGRTFCLILARPRSLRAASLHYLKFVLQEVEKGRVEEEAKKYVKERFESTLDGKSSSKIIHTEAENIGYTESEVISVDTPRDDVKCILAAKDIPSMLKEFYDNPNRRRAYEIVGTQKKYPTSSLLLDYCALPHIISFPPYYLVGHCPGGQLHNRADIIISYILLVGAIVLDVFAATMYVCPYLISKLPSERTTSIILWAVNSIRPLRGRKQWSQEVAQYNMITKYTMQGTVGLLSSVQKWISECSNTCGVELLDSTLTHISITEDLKELVLDKLLEFGKVKEDWNFASSRGQLTLQKRIDICKSEDLEQTSMTKLQDSIGRDVDFPTAVLIWHIATDICYYSEDSTTEVNKKKKSTPSLYMTELLVKLGKKFIANRINRLKQACQVAAELFSIGNEAERWKLISEIWLEMLYYVAPRCGGAFHYEHLSTGGEFITHVLLLMRFLGPFLPIPTASAP
uniref:DUF4220 domain-containing protein n=1 Tax=Oryza rufipogon TaxID=4529 RepID=A0A0E0Q6I6_ORYRU